MKFKTFGRLLGKPSQLLAIALNDLSRAESGELGNVRIDMERAWVRGDPGGASCTACLAGCVVIGSLGVRNPTQLTWAFWNAVEREADALLALDELRKGLVEEAFSYLGIGWPPGPTSLRKSVPIPPYEGDPAGFREAMRGLQRSLAAAGH